MVIDRLQELESRGDAPAAKELARGVLQNDTVEHIEICEAENHVVVTTTHFRGEHDIDLANGVWRTTGTYRVRDPDVDVEIETSMHADAVEPYVRPAVTDSRAEELSVEASPPSRSVWDWVRGILSSIRPSR